MTEKVQFDLVVLIILFFTVFGWFVTEHLNKERVPE